jgi:hypothetical protein
MRRNPSRAGEMKDDFGKSTATGEWIKGSCLMLPSLMPQVARGRGAGSPNPRNLQHRPFTVLNRILESLCDELLQILEE